VAHETATLTFALEDEFSAKFAEIVQKLDQFKRQLEDVTKTGKEGFKGVAENVKQISDHGTGANATLSAMRTHMTDAFLNLNRSLAGTVQGLGQMEGRLTTIGSMLANFGTNFGKVGTAIGLVGGAAAAAAGSVWLLGRALSQSYKDMQNLQIQLGMSESAIVTMERAFARFNKGPEEAHRFLERFNQAIEETRKMAGSETLNRMRTELGAAGNAIANETERIFKMVREGKISKDEGMRLWFKSVYGIQPEDARRKLADIIREQYADMEQVRRHLPQVIPPVEWSEQMKRALENLNKTMRTEMEKISNSWREMWNKLGPTEITKIEEAVRGIGTAIREVMPYAVSEIGQLLTDINNLIESVKSAWAWAKENVPAVRDWSKGERPTDPTEPGIDIPGMFKPKPQPVPGAPDVWRPGIPAIPPQTAPPAQHAPGHWFWGSGWLNDMFGTGGAQQGTAQRFGGWGGADMSGISEESKAAFIDKIMTPANIARGKARMIDLRGGGQELGKIGDPIRETAAGEDIRRMGWDIHEGTEYLRDMRDILKWLQDQLTGAGSNAPGGGPGGGIGGGAPGGAGLGGFAGGGGGMGRRTGSPWFRGAHPGVGQEPGAASGPYSGSLGQQRAQALGSNPQLRKMLLGMAEGEVGGQGERAVQAWLESTLNWGVAHPGQLAQHLQSSYFPPATRGRMRGGDRWSGILDQVLAGSTIAGPSTGNESKALGITKSGGVTLRAGGETFGVEPDPGSRAFAQRFRSGAFPITSQGGPGGGTTGPGGGQVRNYGGGHIGGTIDVGGQSFRFGSGGSLPHIPYGDYPVTPGTIGSWGAAHGALGINNNRIWDPALHRYREGIEFHAASSDAAITAGCIAIAGGQYPQFKQRVLAMIRQHGSATLHIGPGGASVTPGRTASPASLRASGHGTSDTTSHGSQGSAAAAENERAGRPWWHGGGRSGRVSSLGGTHELRGSADVNVNIRHPHGTNVTSSASANGHLGHPRVKTSRTGQMRSAGQNAVNDPNRWGEE